MRAFCSFSYPTSSVCIRDRLKTNHHHGSSQPAQHPSSRLLRSTLNHHQDCLRLHVRLYYLSKVRILTPLKLDHPPYFSAGFGLMGVGVALSGLKRSSTILFNLAQRRLLVTLEISSKDRSYLWFLNWMSKQSRKNSSTNQLAAETSYRQLSDGTHQVDFSLVPGPGNHYFKFQRAWFQVSSSFYAPFFFFSKVPYSNLQVTFIIIIFGVNVKVKRERDGKLIDLNSGTPWETLMLTTLSRDRKLLVDLLKEAKSVSMRTEEGKIVIYTSSGGAEWRPFGQPRTKRPLSSVVLDQGIKETLVADIKEFMGRARWYADRGIPYRRGYLLHGPPGSGKSSFIFALAGELQYHICVLNLSERGLSDDKLNHLLTNVPERSVILLEDDGRMKINITFSGLLNAIDGVTSTTSQRLIFMTTNHVEKLDPALIRPGRIDLSLRIGNATLHQTLELFKKFYEEEPELVSEMEKKVLLVYRNGGMFSMAGLQGLFIRYRKGADAIKEFDQIVQYPQVLT
ncbi:mitochondrial chaperone BCS1 [Puccinia sorghi]|uniref:Mitochondrial chaperone BCS1 n=1 Tax=Puccinia sorghi TaxID=27349 RepID=A0A0L6UV77_9BASI|nr:mitochondrial chaperone BCS1 [Puccinia sorghi]